MYHIQKANCQNDSISLEIQNHQLQEPKAYEAENIFVMPVRENTPSPIQINNQVTLRSPNFTVPQSDKKKKIETPRIIKSKPKCWFV